MRPPEAVSDLREQLQRHLRDSYVVERELTGGGSARVFLATEPALGRRVVLKVLPSDVSRDTDAERFRREILFLARLQHPHLVPLLNAGTVRPDRGGELRWFSMPHVEGDSLRDLITRGPLPIADVLRILRELASALAYAHAQGVVHRDIKPENVLLSHGVSMIADFGVAKALVDAAAMAPDGTRVTTTSTMLGTPAYMAPEQITSATVVDHRADLYAFGCVAYELLTGTPPLVRDSLRATLTAQVHDAPLPIGDLRPDLPPTLAAAIMRCLAKDANRRLSSASKFVDVLDDLTRAVHTSGTFAAVPSAAPHAPPDAPIPMPMPVTAAPRADAAPMAPPPSPASAGALAPATRSGVMVVALTAVGIAVAAATYWFILRA